MTGRNTVSRPVRLLGKDREMPLVRVSLAASEAMRSLLTEKGVQGPVRIELQFTGCCDPSLGLLVDPAREEDLVEQADGLTFIIDPATQELAGEVAIDYKGDGRDAFLVTSANPIGEWDGLITCNLRV
jgi:Fe-S cluster assembly iron-binding protein IscA